MRTRRLVGAAIVLLLGSFLSAFLYLDYVFDKFGECRSVRLTVVPSPDGSKSVVIYRNECGATVPYSTHASIASSGASFSPEDATPFFSVRGVQDMLVTWRGGKVVRIGLVPGAGKIYKRDQSVGDIRIEYE
jgi:hypothetical protein